MAEAIPDDVTALWIGMKHEGKVWAQLFWQMRLRGNRFQNSKVEV